MRQIGLARLTLWMLVGIFVFGCVCMLALPWLLRMNFEVYDIYALHAVAGYRGYLTVFAYLCGLGLLWIIWELIGLFRSIQGNPFVRRNVNGLKRIALAAGVLCLLFISKCIVYPTLMTYVVAVGMLVAMLFTWVLRDLFRQALEYKEDSDLTI